MLKANCWFLSSFSPEMGPPIDEDIGPIEFSPHHLGRDRLNLFSLQGILSLERLTR